MPRWAWTLLWIVPVIAAIAVRLLVGVPDLRCDL